MPGDTERYGIACTTLALDCDLKLAELCPNPAAADLGQIEAVSSFVSALADAGTRRNQDTLRRMREAIDGIQKVKSDAAKKN